MAVRSKVDSEEEEPLRRLLRRRGSAGLQRLCVTGGGAAAMLVAEAVGGSVLRGLRRLDLHNAEEGSGAVVLQVRNSFRTGWA